MIEPNNNKAYPIRSDLFEGKVIVHIKGFADEQGVVSESDYFQREDRRDITWSIQVQGELSRPFRSSNYIPLELRSISSLRKTWRRMEWRCYCEQGLLIINTLTLIRYLLIVKRLHILILRSFQ